MTPNFAAIAAALAWAVVGVEVLPVPAMAAPSDLDPDWADHGRFALPNGEALSNALLQPDGELVLFGSAGGAIRLDPGGQPDATFGEAGRLAPPASDLTAKLVARRAGGVMDVIWTSPPAYIGQGHFTCAVMPWIRYLAIGRADETFSTSEPATTDCSPSSLVAAQDGTSYLLLLGGGTFDVGAGIRHYDSTARRLGDFVATFLDQVGSPPVWVARTLAIDAQNRLVVGLSKRDAHAFGVSRYANDALDTGFGAGGTAVADLPGPATMGGALPLPNGSVLAYGTVDNGTLAQPTVVRYAGNGQVDATFGQAGVATLPMARAGETIDATLVAIDLAGRVIIAAAMETYANGHFVYYTRVGRLRADGSPDLTFGGAGNAAGSFEDGVKQVAVRPTGEILLILGRSAVQLRGGDLTLPHPLGERRAVEYFNADYGHYFMTADDPEQAVLDGTPAAGWSRTGKSFVVYDDATAPLLPVCRFWSGQSFAPKSSHFYTPYPEECAAVKMFPAWQYEGVAFYARLPEGVPDARTCAPGAQPLYRAYNNGMSGAPNHRYMTDLAVLDSMVLRGWTVEGERDTRVFACLPGQD